MHSYRNIDEVKRANREAGGHWFSPDTLRFFSSRILPTLYRGRYFISSERSGFDYDSPRAYTIRIALDNGAIDTVGDFLGYSTRQAAITAIKSLDPCNP